MSVAYIFAFIVDICWNFLLTESPDIVKCLTGIVKLCFPDDIQDLFNHNDGRCATSPLVLIAIFQRLQHLVTGGSMLSTLFEYTVAQYCG